ncbi:MAG: hypothetical protein WAO71_15245 [Gallionella sp.]
MEQATNDETVMAQRPPLSEMLCHDDGYWCLACGRFLPADEGGVIVHDNVPHPVEMTFDEEERPQ